MTWRSVSCKAAFSAGSAARLFTDADHVLDRLLLLFSVCCSGSEGLADILVAVVAAVVAVTETLLSDCFSVGLLHFLRS